MGTNINLLQLESLTQAAGLAEVYVVYDNKDYRMTLATLISLVSKANLGLDKVNNTSDAEKPISDAAAQALASKADKTTVPTKEEFDTLVQSLQGYVTNEQLNIAIQQLTAALQEYSTREEVNIAISEAMSPVTAALESITQTINQQSTAISEQGLAVSGLSDRVAALEQGQGDNGVTQEQLQDAIATATAGINDTITAVSENFQLAVQQLSQRMDAVDGQMANLTNLVQNHTHEAGLITGLEEYVNNLIELSGGAIQIINPEW